MSSTSSFSSTVEGKRRKKKKKVKKERGSRGRGKRGGEGGGKKFRLAFIYLRGSLLLRERKKKREIKKTKPGAIGERGGEKKGWGEKNLALPLNSSESVGGEKGISSKRVSPFRGEGRGEAGKEGCPRYFLIALIYTPLRLQQGKKKRGKRVRKEE